MPEPAFAPHWRTRLRLYWQLMRADRPIGWLLLLWPTWWGLWLAAGGVPPMWTLVVFTAGVWLTRSAGCVVNDYADRWLDPHVERTRGRPLATGAVRPVEARVLFVLLMLAALALVLTLDARTAAMSVVGALLAASYPYLKRYTHFPQVYLGLAFGWGIPMAFVALRGHVPVEGWLLYAANIAWTTGYDTWYAMVDRDDDMRMGARSTAIWFGRHDLIAQAGFYTLALGLLALAGWRAGLGAVFAVSLVVAAALVLQQFRLARARTRDGCFRAFLHNTWVGAVVFAGIALDLAL